MPQDIKRKAFIKAMVNGGQMFATAVLFGRKLIKPFGLSHEIAAEEFIVMIEIRFV